MLGIDQRPNKSVADLVNGREYLVRNGQSFEVPGNLTLEDVEKAAILQSLCRFGGNRTRTARSLGISVRTLQRKLKRWRWEEGGLPDARAQRVPLAVG